MKVIFNLTGAPTYAIIEVPLIGCPPQPVRGIYYSLSLAEDDRTDAFIEAFNNYPTLSDSYKYAACDGLVKWNELQK